MGRLTRSWLEGLVILALVPAGAGAQAVATTFAGVHPLLKTGEYVVVVDRADRETWGRVAALSPSELTLEMVLSIDAGTRIETTAIYPASWDTVDALPPGTDVRVTAEEGGRARYRLDRSTADRLQLLTPSGQPQTLRKSDVLRVERQGIDDPSTDGAIIGALVGAGTALGMVAIAYANCTGSCEAPAPSEMYPAGAAYGAGIGALAGWLIDKLHKGRQTVFPVVSPVLTGRHKGVALSVKF